MTADGELTCVIVDDHPAILTALRDELTERGVSVVGSAADGARGLKAIAANRPTIAVIDVNLGKDSGLDVAGEAISGYSTPVVLFTGEDAKPILEEALRIGVGGIVRKDAPLEDIARAVLTVAAGGSFIDPRLVGSLVRAARTTLTARERSVLSALADGQGYQEIGDHLGIGVETVRAHVRKAVSRLNADGKTAAVATALRLKLID
jgi:DNA-binding NarL/FixJ family response regulator